MKVSWRPIARIAGCVGAVLLAAELIYVVAANAVLFSGVIQREVSKPVENVNLVWDRAFSPWPCRAYVWGLRMRVQDEVQQFHLTVGYAKVDVVLWELLHKEFRASYVQASGVSYRQVVKAESTDGQERRLAAFAPIEGFPRPALLPKTPAPPLTPAELAMLWSVRLDRVDATLSELWFVEFRYRGAGRVHGGFELSPLRRLWIGPALLQLDGGELSAGEHPISGAFTARLDFTLPPVDLPSSPGLRIFHELAARLALDAALADLGAAELYVDGLRASGTGRLQADLEIVGGKLTPRSSIEVSLPATRVQIAGYDFTGDTQAKLWVSEDAQAPTARATLKGRLRAPLDRESVEVALSDVTGEVVFADNDISRGLSPKWLHATGGEARVKDASPITRKVCTIVPILPKLVLGDGPLVASASAYLTPAYTLVRLERVKLGNAEIGGAAVAGANGWNGAAAGLFSGVRIGLRLQDGKLGGVPFVSTSWLSEELAKVGIEPEVAARVE
jgi:hypothetical protein